MKLPTTSTRSGPAGDVSRIRELPVFPVTPGPVRPDVDPSVEAVSFEPSPEGPEGGPRIALVTLGCDKNTVDSERMMAALVGNGARVGVEPDTADVVIVNTCGFIESAKAQSIETLLEACALKEEGDVQAVVAVGCMVQRYKDELEEEIPEVDLFMGLTELQGLVPELRGRGLLPDDSPPVPLMERPLRVLTGETPHTSFLKVSEGCDHTCAFCAIPQMRGLHRSAPLDALVAEARSLGRAGVRELNVISQDTTWYGRDLRRRDPDAPLLPDLLRALLRETEVDWYRLFYMYPSGLTPELVELLAAESADGRGPRLVPYLDMPLQHGSDRILTAMRRPERRATIRERVRWLRDAVPDITLRTTVIVGFPGETDEDFRELVDLLEEIQFDRVGGFTYSPEDGTRAAAMEDSVPASLKRERLEELMDVQRGISFERNLEQVGTVRRVLVDRRLEGTDADPDFEAVGRTESQALDVDGATQLLPTEDGVLTP
ncbi:MAG: 30S ribosomal protein S12 methylthiotransferase RimO, partial [Gemmatimonadetes bacterium]|nr:30S ribosomal protein S12 methylthiotransferase RimO [Gemmatimonadota bacterium]